MRIIKSLFIVFVFCASVFSQTMPVGADPAVWARAMKIHQKSVIVDGHNDVPSPMVDEDFDLSMNTVGKFHKDGDPFHTDLARLKASGITGEFFAIYVGGNRMQTHDSMRRAMDLIDATYREVEKHPAALTMCTTADEIRRAKKQKKICILMGIEGGYAIENSLYALRNFYRLGIRYMTLTHNVTHDWADSHVTEPKHGGLNEFGREVVKEMNRLGMLVDISHVSVDTMNDTLDVSTAPIIASHSSARAVNDHTRNVPDDVLKRIATNGGVVMVNFLPAFLDARNRKEENDRTARLKPQVDALREQYKDDRQAFLAAQRKLYAEHPVYVPTYARIVDHIDHIKNVAGIDYVGLGSDYDGIGGLPAGMNGAEDTALVTYEMLRRGYSETEIRKVLGENFLRAFAKAEQVAGRRQVSGQGSLMKIRP